MKFAEINKAFTEKVAEYMSKGYHINVATMSGSQSGEIGKIDLTDGKELIRVLLEADNEHEISVEKRWGYIYDITRLTVGRATGRFELDTSNTWDTVWNNRLEVIESREWYGINLRGHEVWYGTKLEAEAAQEVRLQRHNAADVSKIVWETESEAARKAVLPRIKREPGMKSCKASDITKIRHWVEIDRHGKADVSYIVVAKGKSIRLH